MKTSRQVEEFGIHRELPNLFGHFQDRRLAGLPAPLEMKNSGSVGDRPEWWQAAIF